MQRLEKYGRLIGYNFGADDAGNDRVYLGNFRGGSGRLVYLFGYYDRAGRLVYSECASYSAFRAIIDGYAWPKC